MFRKITAMLIALMMLMACCAMAEEVTLTPIRTGFTNYAQTADDHYIIITEASGLKGIITNSGEALTDSVYTFLEELDYGYYASATVTEGVNITGIIDVNGNQIAANQYISVNVLSARWGIGAYGIPATESDYVFDIMNADGGYDYYSVDTVDIIDLTTGTVAGNLPYSKCYGGEPFYDCLLLQDVDGNVTVYDSTITPIDYQPSSVYENLYEGVDGNIVFKPTGAAVVSGYEYASWGEVAGQDVLFVTTYDEDYNSLKGIVDMAGNVIAPLSAQSYMAYDRNDTVITAYEDDFYGLYDVASGTQILPNIYDDIVRSYSSVDKYVNNGYVCVEKDDMLGFVDLNGNVTCEIKYPTDNAELLGCVLAYENDDGTTTIVAADGVETVVPYEITSYRAGGNGLLLPVEDADSMCGIIDWHGNVKVPCIYEWGLTITGDSSAAIVYGENGYDLLAISVN